MVSRILLSVCLLFLCFADASIDASAEDLSSLKSGQRMADFRVTNLYSDSEGRIVGAKFRHIPTDAPVFLLQIETVPQAFMWVDTPIDSDRGLPHSLEHLLASKGTKGRYLQLVGQMSFGQTTAATYRDFNFFELSNAAGMDAFFDQFHALLDALYNPDFSDVEAEREFYHFGVSTDPTTQQKLLIEAGAVYDEMLTGQGSNDYFFALNKMAFGDQNPFGFNSGGVPNEMRDVTPKEIRQFHDRHYRLGPTVGFIFALDPRENAVGFLQRVSEEFHHFSQSDSKLENIEITSRRPKYPVHPSNIRETRIYKFPGGRATDPGEVRFSWRPKQIDSLVDLKLLQLLFRALAEGERSLLYKSLVDSQTRELDVSATAVESEPFLGNSPFFPVWNVGISGIPGNRITIERVNEIEKLILDKIRLISQYPDRSENLEAFNELVFSYSQSWRRTQRVWIKSPPGFGSGQNRVDWKNQFEVLEMESSFVRSLSEEEAWQAIERKLKSKTNIWHDLIEKFGLMEPPFAAASMPSASLLEQLEKQKEERIKNQVKALMERYHANTEQDALSTFEKDEMIKTKAIDEVEASIPRPSFTAHPPLTPDDQIRYTQFQLEDTPIIAALFDRPPTIDIGLSFDLRRIPRKYYKFLPILPRCLDSLGLKQGNQVTTYSELIATTRNQLYDFSIGYDYNIPANRFDLTIRASATNVDEFREALNLIRGITQYNYLDMSNADRLRDIVEKRLSGDDSYTKKDESDWILNPAYSFRNQKNKLFLSVGSQFTWNHWDARLKWLVHKPVSAEEIARMAGFAKETLTSASMSSRQELSRKLAGLDREGVNGELVDYWQRNLSSFPDDELVAGLGRLASEVEHDLKTGPARTIEDLKELQKIVLNRHALTVDLTLSESALNEIRPELVKFLQSIKARPFEKRPLARSKENSDAPIMAKLERRYGMSRIHFPWYVGFVNPDGVTGNVIAYADFPGYAQIDHKSLVNLLSSKLFSGNGPQSFHMKALEAGLAYNSFLTSEPEFKLAWYYADRSPDIPALLGLVESAVAKVPDLRDPYLVDYALRQSFPFPRETLTFSERGKALAQDIRNGNPPQRVRRFSEAILGLRQDPHLLSELTQSALTSISGVLLDKKYRKEQQASRSIFFIVAPEKILADTEIRLPIPKLLRLWPGDYWIE